MVNCYANWPLVLEYLKVALSWPPMVVVLAAILLPTFGVPLATLLRNIRKGKAAGIEFEVEAEKQQGSPLPALAADDHLGQIAANPVTAKAEILKWWRAATHENNFHKIYGTQIRLLEHLANQPGRVESEANLLPFHLEHLKLVEAANNPVPTGYWTQFIGFLFSVQYIEKDAESGKVRLSALGEDFLLYIRNVWGSYAATRVL